MEDIRYFSWLAGSTASDLPNSLYRNLGSTAPHSINIFHMHLIFIR